MIRSLTLAVVLVLAGMPGVGLAGQGLHYTYLWHLEQPIYWPAPDTCGLRGWTW
ncbi:MAG: hypothetical protein ISR64_02735 [Deltaproteobacteria bacterium]|nr:hypothetical protein [Deltaproteobacteria bacterium]